MLRAIVLLLVLVSGSALRLKSTEKEECGGKTQEWIQEGDKRRLKGPVFFIHVSNHGGRFFTDAAVANGGYNAKGMVRWSQVDDANNGKTIFDNSPAAPDSKQKFDMFEDGSWTSIESPFGWVDSPESAQFKQHTLDDLGCGGGQPLVLATSARHPVENLISYHALLEVTRNGGGLMHSCESDNLALRLWAGKSCFHMHPVCAPLTRDDLEVAKARADKMDAIFVLEHMPATIKLACTRLGWKNCEQYKQQHHNTSTEILDSLDSESWNQLFERNKLGIEFYEHLKALSFKMLEEDGLPVPTQEEQDQALPQLRSLEHARALSKAHGSQFAAAAASMSTRWQCGPR